MDMTRFSRPRSLFGHRHSRHDPRRNAGHRIGAAIFGKASARKVAVRSATPTPEDEPLGLPEGERLFTMFVQTARAGTWEARPDEEGVYTLTLTGLPAQTVYFSDRPNRVVGMQSTADFLNALGFIEENPPNAALVTKADDGQDDILVIELFNPVYTESEEGATLVYKARILENYHETGLGRLALEQDHTSIPSTFDGASLFIDDCVDGAVDCYREGVLVGRAHWGCCYSFPACRSCHGETAPYRDVCTQITECADGKCGSDWYRQCGPVN